MTATTDRRPAPETPARRPNRIVRTASDTATIVKRNLLHVVRTPQLLVFSTIQPVMFVLLFAFVFGGSIQIPEISYVDWLIPGILVQTAVFGSTQTAVGLAEDLSKGIVDRFRSLPMARSAVLTGRTIADSVRNVFVIALMFAVGAAIGFRFRAGLLPALGAFVLAVAFGFAISWVAACIGLATRNPEAAQPASFVPFFPLVFASSAFAPTDNMPGWLQVFAEHQPITLTVNALRALTLGSETAEQLFGASTPVLVAQSLAWIVGLVAVFAPLAVRLYRRSG